MANYEKILKQALRRKKKELLEAKKVSTVRLRQLEKKKKQLQLKKKVYKNLTPKQRLMVDKEIKLQEAKKREVKKRNKARNIKVKREMLEALKLYNKKINKVTGKVSKKVGKNLAQLGRNIYYNTTGERLK